jgi:hypothetical protein
MRESCLEGRLLAFWVRSGCIKEGATTCTFLYFMFQSMKLRNNNNGNISVS